MEPSLHSVLLVEDDEAIAEDVGEILRSLACHYDLFDNRDEAVAAARSGDYCIAIVDLQVKAGPRALRPHVEHGKGLVRELRAMHPRFIEEARTHEFPILVVSGFAEEVPEAVEVMKDGADNILQKPFRTNRLSSAIRALLEKAGRARHADCQRLHPVTHRGAGPLLSIPGRREGRRTVVCVGSRETTLPDASLRVLLELVVGLLQGHAVHKNDMGGDDARGFKGISRLNEHMKPATGSQPITENEYGVGYRLADNVELGDIDYDALDRIGNAQIAALASRIMALRAETKGDGKS